MLTARWPLGSVRKGSVIPRGPNLVNLISMDTKSRMVPSCRSMDLLARRGIGVGTDEARMTTACPPKPAGMWCRATDSCLSPAPKRKYSHSGVVCTRSRCCVAKNCVCCCSHSCPATVRPHAVSITMSSRVSTVALRTDAWQPTV